MSKTIYWWNGLVKSILADVAAFQLNSLNQEPLWLLLKLKRENTHLSISRMEKDQSGRQGVK